MASRSPGPYKRPSTYRYSVAGGSVRREELETENAERAIRRVLIGLDVENVDEQLSPMEVDLLAAMWYVGLNPELQATFGPYRVDFLFPTEHVVVEVDGRDWHGSNRWQADRRRQRYLRDVHDLVVKRFTGSEVFRQPIICARHIKFTVEWIHDRLDLVKKAS